MNKLRGPISREGKNPALRQWHERFTNLSMPNVFFKFLEVPFGGTTDSPGDLFPGFQSQDGFLACTLSCLHATPVVQHLLTV